ncbi:peptide-methionine (S)-S-oxide reductase MsrA [Flavobacteriales bacterium]|nr:peptide-methionine (S)-S-oxide reductase MsrA [Flavobacteriales bacterium]
MKFIVASVSVVLIGAMTIFGTTKKEVMSDSNEATLEKATFGAGCFWCVEAVFQDIKGVTKVESGYTGGHVKNPAYREVCNGTTGHAEVIQLTYNPAAVSYETLLEAFWLSHDPTTLNRQGADVGTQYRSAIFYHNEEQGKLAKDFKKRLNDEKAFGNPVVTEITAASVFYPAEDYHQDYYENNPTNSYCRMVVGPKLEKFRKVFKQPEIN